jgi:hypothetical protein
MNVKLAEYNALRSQIEGQFRLIVQVFTVSVIASVALFGYVFQSLVRSSSFSNEAVFLLLTPLAIFVPCAYFLSSLRREIFEWGAYIQVFLEGEKDNKYETMRAKFRERYKPKESLSPIAWTYWALFAMCAGAFIWRVLSVASVSRPWIAIILIPLGFLIKWYTEYVRIPFKDSSEALNRWRKIKDQ